MDRRRMCLLVGRLVLVMVERRPGDLETAWLTLCIWIIVQGLICLMLLLVVGAGRGVVRLGCRVAQILGVSIVVVAPLGFIRLQWKSMSQSAYVLSQSRGVEDNKLGP